MVVEEKPICNLYDCPEGETAYVETEQAMWNTWNNTDIIHIFCCC